MMSVNHGALTGVGDLVRRSVSARAVVLGLGSLAGLVLIAAPVRAETISHALAQAYVSNPDLNQQRAGVRVTDEGMGRAKAGYLPKVGATGSIGYQYTDARPVAINDQKLGNSIFPRATANRQRYTGAPRGAALQVQQTLFDGFKTSNTVRQTESQIFAQRETMRNTEQNVLTQAATSYMNVLRDAAILNLRRSNIAVLEEQLRQTRDRFQVGEVTRTDVAQAGASLAQARSDYFAAQANLQASIANYRQVVGVEPKRLEPAQTVERLLPKRLSDAVEISQVEHPAMDSALHTVDVASLAVKIAEAALYPTVTLNGQVGQNQDFNGVQGFRSFSGSVFGQINVPIYQGGGEYAAIRQAKEQVSQARLNADLARDQVRAAVVTSWGQLEAAKAQIASGQAAVAAAEIALNGIREEAKVGQRTTFDVLNAQQTLLNARVNLVVAQRDRVVGSYSVLSSIGRINVDMLGLNVDNYDASVHFNQVKDKLFGVRTPDGR
jgi:outer membrane protein